LSTFLSNLPPSLRSSFCWMPGKDRGRHSFIHGFDGFMARDETDAREWVIIEQGIQPWTAVSGVP
jgi:hypothetical protein